MRNQTLVGPTIVVDPETAIIGARPNYFDLTVVGKMKKKRTGR